MLSDGTKVTAPRFLRQAARRLRRLEKELEDTAMKLTSVLPDVTGLSSRRILQELIAGQRDPAVLADLAVGSARKKIPALVEALDGTFTGHHGFMCRHYLDQIDHIDAVIVVLDARIASLLTDHDEDLRNLDSIPGIGRRAAEIIIAETGGDMAPSATAANLASWIGVCVPGSTSPPGSGGPGASGRGNGNLKQVLGVAAMAAVRGKDSYYGVYYRRLGARRGRRRALVAVMHKLAVATWHVLHDKTEHRDIGADYFAKRDPQRAIRRMTREANALGMTVRFDPIPEAV